MALICSNVQFIALATFTFAVLQLISQLNRLNRTDMMVNQCELSTSPTLSLPACARFQQSTSDKRPILRNIHLVMIGDSYMRYQYLSLAYRLRHGVWFHESLWYYNLVKEQTFESPFHPFTWSEFMLQTNKVLQPLEVCDCFRQAPANFGEVIENRYFYDPVHNNSLTFLLSFGHVIRMKGRLLPSQIRNVSSKWQMKALRDRQSTTWMFGDWSKMITGYVRKLDPPPKHVIMNAGAWSHKFGWSKPPTANETGIANSPTKNVLQSIKNATPIQFGWRTTTYMQHGISQDQDGDEVMCMLLPICINVSFTRNVRANYYWDGKHFLEPVYRAENEEMLNVLGYLPKDYVRMNLGQILD